jgi:hypothetical protein
MKMKKIIIAAIAVGFAAITQAASVNWNSGTIKLPDGTTTAGAGAVQSYLFVLSDTDYGKLTSGADVWNTYGDSLATASKSGASNGMGVANLTDNTKAYSTGDSAYAAIIYTVQDADGNVTHYNATYNKWTFTSNQTKSMANTFTSANATGWTAVPEPTSGLLMLVGLAGLALRRRRV